MAGFRLRIGIRGTLAFLSVQAIQQRNALILQPTTLGPLTGYRTLESTMPMRKLVNSSPAARSTLRTTRALQGAPVDTHSDKLQLPRTVMPPRPGAAALAAVRKWRMVEPAARALTALPSQVRCHCCSDAC
jgi:hypothetical protein